MGRSDFVFGVGDSVGRGGGDDICAEEILKETFDGVEFAGDTLEGILFAAKVVLEALEILGGDGGNISYSQSCEKFYELI